MDLDEVVRVLRGRSGIRAGWQAYVIFVPQWNCFVELQSTPSDLRGNSKEDATEVSDGYLIAEFGLSPEQLSMIRDCPAEWRFLEMRE